MSDYYKHRNGDFATPIKDYRERFEFRFTVGTNIICQRFFKIPNFNEDSFSSLELVETMQYCAQLIDKDLKDKTNIYLEMMSPRVFETVEDMETYFENPYNKVGMHLGEGIVVKKKNVNYFWGKNDKPELCKEKFDIGSEFITPLTDDDFVEYKLTLYDNGPQFLTKLDEREVCSVVWTGCYPKAVRMSIDISNKKGRMNPEDIAGLKFETYVAYKMAQGKKDIVYTILNSLINICSWNKENNENYYTTALTFGKTKYDNIEYARYCKREIKKLSV